MTLSEQRDAIIRALNESRVETGTVSMGHVADVIAAAINPAGSIGHVALAVGQLHALVRDAMHDAHRDAAQYGSDTDSIDWEDIARTYVARGLYGLGLAGPPPAPDRDDEYGDDCRDTPT